MFRQARKRRFEILHQVIETRLTKAVFHDILTVEKTDRQYKVMHTAA